MQRKKLTVVQLLPELEEGGVEGETVDFALYLAARGHRSIVISGGGRLVDRLEKGGCEHFLWRYVGEKSVRCLKYIRQLEKFLLNENVDVLHSRSRLPAWIGYFAYRRIPVKKRPALISSFHGFYSVNSYSSIMTKGGRVIAVSKTIQQHILDKYSVERDIIRCIYGGFDQKAFDPAEVSAARIMALRKQWLPEGDSRRVVMLPGRITLWKGQDVFIESIAEIADQLGDTVCLLVGAIDEKSSYQKKLRELVREHQLEDKVLFVGHCDDMPAALALADVVVSASSTQPEAFGKIAIEAMAMAKPVIATAHGGSLETVVHGKTGWLIPPLDSGQMASAILSAMKNPALKSFGEEGRRHVLDNFTALKMCEETLAVYDEALQEKWSHDGREKLTVLQMLPELNSGGVERGTLEMGRFLAAKGHNSMVISAGGRLVDQLVAEGSSHIAKKVGAKSPMALTCLPRLRKIIKNEVDILHLRSRMPAWLGYLAWLSLPKLRRPVLVSTFHGFYSVNAYSAVMVKGDGVIAVSRAIREHIASKYGRKEDVRLIFRGVELDSFSPEIVGSKRVLALKEKWGIKDDVKVLMLPGRLTRLKGQKIFLKSLTRLKEMNFLALLVGDTRDNPGYANELDSYIAANGLGSMVKMVGHCDDMPAAYMIADVVISASSSEPEAFGRTTVEAMAMQCPVVATAHGGSLETVAPGENGWLVAPSDYLGLAKALGEALALDAKHLRAMGDKNRQRVTKHFTAKAMCGQTLSYYYELFEKKLAEKASTKS